MRLPASWLTEIAQLPRDDVGSLTEMLERLGFEVEQVSDLDQITGPLLVGRVVEITELTEFNKPIRYCHVDVGEHASDGTQPAPRGIICGATNFESGDLVVVALPGAVLPGNFQISARSTYGHISDGMVASMRELGLGEDHEGILVLPHGTAEPGDPAADLLGLADAVIDMEITPNRGDALSARGLARELAAGFAAAGAATTVRDPAADAEPASGTATADGQASVLSEQGLAQRFTTLRVDGLDPAAPSPWWLRRRLSLCGIRSISLAVDVTNYVMLELGQPLHAFDSDRLHGQLTVRSAREGEKLRTLDDRERALVADDVVICDDSGPISLAGVMGGSSTEIVGSSSSVVLEAACWIPERIARTVRRHHLPSEASRRFERGVDAQAALPALYRAARLLASCGGGRIAGHTDTGAPAPAAEIALPARLPAAVAGVAYPAGTAEHCLRLLGAQVRPADPAVQGEDQLLQVRPPSWRNDLQQPEDLVEEVVRLQGLDAIPAIVPQAPAGAGLTAAQRLRRRVSRTLAEAGYVEVLPTPFLPPTVWDEFGLAETDPLRSAAVLSNPLDIQRSVLATTLLPGMLRALRRNVERGQRAVALYGVQQVVLPRADAPPMPAPAAATPPSDEELTAIGQALPRQPLHAAVVMAGPWEQAGWWGHGRPADWSDALAAAQRVARAAAAELEVRSAERAPWHPGRCAELMLDGVSVGHAGELHPAVVERMGLPARTCAMEFDVSALPLQRAAVAPEVSSYPPVLQDVALVVDATVPAGQLQRALREGGGDLLDEVRPFDLYEGSQLAPGTRSLAFSLRFRAPDRTLTAEEAAQARDAAVNRAGELYGARLRG